MKLGKINDEFQYTCPVCFDYKENGNDLEEHLVKIHNIERSKAQEVHQHQREQMHNSLNKKETVDFGKNAKEIVEKAISAGDDPMILLQYKIVEGLMDETDAILFWKDLILIAEEAQIPSDKLAEVRAISLDALKDEEEHFQLLGKLAEEFNVPKDSPAPELEPEQPLVGIPESVSYEEARILKARKLLEELTSVVSWAAKNSAAARSLQERIKVIYDLLEM